MRVTATEVHRLLSAQTYTLPCERIAVNASKVGPLAPIHPGSPDAASVSVLKAVATAHRNGSSQPIASSSSTTKATMRSGPNGFCPGRWARRGLPASAVVIASVWVAGDATVAVDI